MPERRKIPNCSNGKIEPRQVFTNENTEMLQHSSYLAANNFWQKQQISFISSKEKLTHFIQSSYIITGLHIHYLRLLKENIFYMKIFYGPKQG